MKNTVFGIEVTDESMITVWLYYILWFGSVGET